MSHQDHFDRNTHKGRALDDGSLGVFANALLQITGVVVDGETVTVGAEVYEFDDDASVVAGNILVDVTGDLTAANALAKLTLAINASGKSGVRAEDPVDGVNMDLIAQKAHDNVSANVALAETIGNGAIDTAMQFGKKGTPPMKLTRSPSALEVVAGRMKWFFDREVSAVQVHVRTTAGVVKAWDGGDGFNDTEVTLDNGGAVDWVATDRVTLDAVL
ncbi:hypothetical protein LCGC14_0472300 [marine sediment metagenome]|uniref:Uncharacterized protein n=1 Tax=marine sediment metagenome TaxID=412755 RepID=A0A0F9VKV0_9ZZZZ